MSKVLLTHPTTLTSFLCGLCDSITISHYKAVRDLCWLSMYFVYKMFFWCICSTDELILWLYLGRPSPLEACKVFCSTPDLLSISFVWEKCHQVCIHFWCFSFYCIMVSFNQFQWDCPFALHVFISFPYIRSRTTICLWWQFSPALCVTGYWTIFQGKPTVHWSEMKPKSTSRASREDVWLNLVVQEIICELI